MTDWIRATLAAAYGLGEGRFLHVDHSKSDCSMIRRNDCAAGFARDSFLSTVWMDDDEIAVDSPHDQIASICGTRERNSEREEKDDA
jgi:hypothetical protein